MSLAHIGSNLILNNSLIGTNESLIAYFPFNNTTKDTIRGIDANVNTAVLSPQGVRLSESSMLIYNEPIIQVSSQFWCIFGWYKRADYSGMYSYFLEKIGTGTLSIGSYGARKYFCPNWTDAISSYNAVCNSGAGNVVPEDAWRFFALRRDKSIITSFEGYNGQLYFSDENRGDYFNSHVTTGWQLPLNSNYKGLVKNLGFLNEAISNQEVLQIYTNSNNFYIPNKEITFL